MVLKRKELPPRKKINIINQAKREYKTVNSLFSRVFTYFWRILNIIYESLLMVLEVSIVILIIWKNYRDLQVLS